MLRDFHALFRGGLASGQTDGQLLGRFLSGDEGSAEAAFAALVERHGPMVLRLCRRVLGDPHIAEDASQAVFLILARHAGSIRDRDSVASWLFGVASRVSAQARAGVARRRFHERRGAEMVAKTAADGGRPEEWPELYEELGRLPEQYRAPLVLCYLEGMTHEAAASQLGWTLRTVRSRLVTARERLRGRLVRRGAALPAGFLAAGSGAKDASAAVSPSWLDATVRGAMAAHAGKAAGIGAVTGTAGVLAENYMRKVLMIRLAWISAAVATAGAALGVVFAASDGAMKRDERPPSAAAAPRPKPAADEKAGPREDVVEVRGRVLDPSGKPVSGAKLYLGPDEPFERMPAPPAPRAMSGPDGSFRFEVAKSALATRPNIAALAAGFGPAWKRIDVEAASGVSLTLGTDDVPLDGRIIDLEGRPVPGAEVNVVGIIAPPGGDLAGWLRASAEKSTQEFWPDYQRRALEFGGIGTLPGATTGADGRFHLTGIGRDRIAVIDVRGASVAHDFAVAVTRSDRGGPPLSLPPEPGFSGKLQGPDVAITAAPTRPVEGIVRDGDTGLSISGVKLSSTDASIVAVTDDQGRYRLVGLPKADREGGSITTETEGQPYLKTIHELGNPPGLGPVKLDIVLKRGAWVEGRVVDGTTGLPVIGAKLEYFPFRDNPAVADAPNFTGLNNNVSDEAEAKAGPDGRFRIVALPGRGILAVRAGGYRTAAPLDPAVAGNVLHAGNFQYQMGSYQGLVEVDVARGAGVIRREVALSPGHKIQGLVRGPGGAPVAGAKVYGLKVHSFQVDPLPGAAFTYFHPNPGQVETLTFVQEQSRLGAAIDLKGDESGPVRVDLLPTGAIAGRLVDEDGRPRRGVSLPILFSRMHQGRDILGDYLVRQVKTDGDGRFRVELLIAGVKYQILVAGKDNPRGEGYIDNARSTVAAGEVKDLGDVRERRVKAD